MPANTPYRSERVSQGSSEFYTVVNPYTGETVSDLFIRRADADAIAKFLNEGGVPPCLNL